MIRKFFVIVGLLGLCPFLGIAEPLLLYAQENAQSRKGLHFGVPEDWPIEKRGGVLAPVPIEEYVMNRFRNMASQIDATKNELKGLIQGIRADLEDFKNNSHQRLGDLQQELEFIKSNNRPAAADSVPAASSLDADRVKNLEYRLEAIHKDLTAKLESLNLSLDGLEQKRLRSLQFNLDVLDEKVKLLIEEFEKIR